MKILKVGNGLQLVMKEDFVPIKAEVMKLKAKFEIEHVPSQLKFSSANITKITCFRT